MSDSPQDAGTFESIYDLLRQRRIPYEETVGEIRARFETVQDDAGPTRVILRGLEPLILSMTEPLELEHLLADDALPQAFLGRVNVHDTATANFETAKAEFTTLLGPGFAPNRAGRSSATSEWWWNGGKVQISATSPSQRKGLFQRLLAPGTRSTSVSECLVRIEPRFKRSNPTKPRNIVDRADEIAHRYNDLIDRLGGASPPTEEELVAMLHELNESSKDLGSSKAHEMSQLTLDQDLRVQHMQSLVSPDDRLSYPRYSGPPDPDKLAAARARLGPR